MIDLNNQTQFNYLRFDFNNLPNAVYDDGLIRGVAPNTARQYRATTKYYCDIIDPTLFNHDSKYLDFKPSLIDYLNFCRDSGFSFPTIKTHFNALNNTFLYLIDNGIISFNPIPQFRKRYIRIFKNPPCAPKQDLGVEDVELLIKTVPKLNFKDEINIEKYISIILTFSLTGLRINELIPLNLYNYDHTNGFIHLGEPNKIQGKRTNTIIPVSRQIVDAINAYLFLREQRGEILTSNSPLFLNELGTGRLTDKTLQLQIQKIGTLCGLHNPSPDAQSYEKVTAHTFRHFFTKTMRELGMPIAYIAEMRGDKRSFFAIQDWYYQITYRELKKVYNLYIPILRIPDTKEKFEIVNGWLPAAINTFNVFDDSKKQ
ncbi:tyrosine-type recombinase/integrase [Methanimicrococcus stummii]|nr:tyrosine-type recombinase/integrase [Methanimicrococcus sp. Es2]